MYVWITGTVIAHVGSHMNDLELFQDYYERFVEQVHPYIKKTLFKVCYQFVKGPERIVQVIKNIHDQQQNLTDSRLLCTRQYIIDF